MGRIVLYEVRCIIDFCPITQEERCLNSWAKTSAIREYPYILLNSDYDVEWDCLKLQVRKKNRKVEVGKGKRRPDLNSKGGVRS